MTYVVIAVFIGLIFLVDGVTRMRRQSEWKRRYKETQ